MKQSGDATHQIITTGRIPYSKQLPDPPAAPTVSSPSRSSFLVRWTAPQKLGDFPIIGYRLVRRAGGSQEMGFGHDLIVDENTFKVGKQSNSQTGRQARRHAGTQRAGRQRAGGQRTHTHTKHTKHT